MCEITNDLVRKSNEWSHLAVPENDVRQRCRKIVIYYKGLHQDTFRIGDKALCSVIEQTAMFKNSLNK